MADMVGQVGQSVAATEVIETSFARMADSVGLREAPADALSQASTARTNDG
jgi:hypothetical protein